MRVNINMFLIIYLVYFLVKGAATFVLPRLDNRPYREIVIGECFGHCDLAKDLDFLDENKKAKRHRYSD